MNALTAEHRDYLNRAAITDETLDRLGIYSETDPDLGPGIVFPWVDRDGTRVESFRPWTPEPEGPKYIWPAKTPLILWQVRPEPTPDAPVLLVEGHKQALAVASWAPAEYAVYAMNGCHGTRRKDGPPMDLTWTKGRDVRVLLDADAATNRRVYEAGMDLAKRLTDAGAEAGFVRLPGVGTEGADDCLAKVDPAVRTAWLGLQLGQVHATPAGAEGEAEIARLDEAMPVTNWDELWADTRVQEWYHPLIPAARLTSIYSAPKVGKSLTMLEIAAGLASGREVLGHQYHRTVRVGYVDFENDMVGDIRERLQAMGYGPKDLGNLVYTSFPSMETLDTPQGGAMLLAWAQRHQVELVVIDTVSRIIQGEENANDTWLKAYQYAWMPLRRAGIAVLRLDHSGKDESKGQRGGSAKVGDVDLVWRLSKGANDLFVLDCEQDRVPPEERRLVIRRETEPFLRHTRVTSGDRVVYETKRQEVEEVLDASTWGPDHTPSSRDAKKLLEAAGVTCGATMLGKILKERSERQAGPKLQGIPLGPVVPVPPQSRNKSRKTA